MNDIDPEVYRRWTPAAQEKALNLLRGSQSSKWRPFYCGDPECPGTPHDKWDWSHARPDQRPPREDGWTTWLLKSGRGSGKTRTGNEYTHRVIEHVPRIALVGATTADVRDIMLEGESGLLTIYPPGKKPVHEPSKRRLTFHNGAVATLFSAEEPDRLRGPENYFAWCDEPAHWPLVQQVWDNLMFGLRLGKNPRVIATTTPKPRPWLKTLIQDPSTRISVASTYDNLANLSPAYAEYIIRKYEGTRLGRQELEAELLEDVEGALWTWELIESARVSEAPDDLRRIVVAVDPAGSRKATADETAIVVVGLRDDHAYVLADRSGHYSPIGWASAAMNAYEEYSADAIIAEVNFGGDMVTANLRAIDATPRIRTVRAKKAKALRAEPVVSLYEQSRVHHVGSHPDLETQMTEWVPYSDSDSPDRVDALVYAITDLVKAQRPAAVANPANLRVVRGGAA
jgi:phage terminase large subunit-like protein